mgnify:CR=1 FL=1
MESQDELAELAHTASVIRLVNQLLSEALRQNASDVHVEPQERGLIIRYRIDGLLHVALTPPREVLTGLTSRIKILANMDAGLAAQVSTRMSMKGGL